jgi:hypothetical protein
VSIDRKALKPYSAIGKSVAPDLKGTWQNELGSIMTITSFDGKTFSGTYASAVSSGGESVTGTLAGTLAGDAIGFTVNWGAALGSVTSWSGLLFSGGEPQLFIYSLWYLTTTPSSEVDYWESTLAGFDFFTQTTS